ncbi:MAG: hypothetical protein KGJ13_00700 [Patescibacteria group bacterium]|nr:hypothetical protein [Patescibacteria group bacterium]
MAKGKVGAAAKDIATAVGLDLTVAPLATAAFKKLWDKLTNKAGEVAEKKISELSQPEKRRLLAKTLVSMKNWDEKKNILFLLKIARAKYKETERVKDLGEFICDEKEPDVRRQILKDLNACLPSGPIDPSEEGDILIELLDDNGPQQKLEWLRDKSGEAIESVRAHMPEAQQQLESAGDALAPFVDSITSWLRRH